jgi:hypothetical protein
LEGARTGNWTSLTCSDIAVTDEIGFTPQQRWGMLDAADAWANVISTYQQYDAPAGRTFMDSVHNTLHGPELVNCGELGADSSCSDTVTCQVMASAGTGDSGAPAAYELWNSMVRIHDVSTTAPYSVLLLGPPFCVQSGV